MLEFSFSVLFKRFAVAFMLMFKVLWVYMETWIIKAVTEKMLALPFECALQTVQFVMTLGAADFISFINAFLVESAIMVS